MTQVEETEVEYRFTETSQPIERRSQVTVATPSGSDSFSNVCFMPGQGEDDKQADTFNPEGSKVNFLFLYGIPQRQSFKPVKNAGRNVCSSFVFLAILNDPSIVSVVHLYARRLWESADVLAGAKLPLLLVVGLSCPVSEDGKLRLRNNADWVKRVS